MKIRELHEEILSWNKYFSAERTCDTFKCGDPEAEIVKVGSCMFATVDVIRECRKRGINYLIVHEPTFYDHWDVDVSGELVERKKALLKETGLTISRFHDNAHGMEPDLIYEGELQYLGLAGKCEKGKFFGGNFFVLDEPLTAKELAEKLEERLGVKNIRIAGCLDKKGDRIACCFGATGGHDIVMRESNFVIVGETCEWRNAEMARDYAAFGENKALLAMGHEGSERAGMMLLVEKIKKVHPELSVEYIESGEVYNYTK